MTGPDGAVPSPAVIAADSELLPGEVPLPLEFETRGGDGPGDWKVTPDREAEGA